MVAFARAHSPYYRELYRGLPERVEDPALLPVTDKPGLMARFDDWVTDPRVKVAEARAFIDDPDRIGQRFLDSYLIAHSSGTSGYRGIFLMDRREAAVHAAIRRRALRRWLGPRDAIGVLAKRGRAAAVTAIGGHFIGLTVLRNDAWQRRLTRSLSVHAPLPELVERLNRIQPAILNGYAATIAQLAVEQEAGRLRIKPVLILLAAEALAPEEQDRLAAAFDAKVRDSYGTTECPFLSHSCEHRWLHVNTDWALFEPVDAEQRPVAPGERSHSVLITNLANRVQPRLRYRLDDVIVQRPDPCPCGSPLPAIRVQGRSAEFTFAIEGRRVSIPSTVVGGVAEAVAGVERFQVVQTGPATLRVRLVPADGVDQERPWKEMREGLARLLANMGARHVSIERGDEPPQQSQGGKYRRFLPLQP
jgi:phenylacetate-coenzyme A ligase PaaK-like adenylate-forming protein